jgi:hypothetical protein
MCPNQAPPRSGHLEGGAAGPGQTADRRSPVPLMSLSRGVVTLRICDFATARSRRARIGPTRVASRERGGIVSSGGTRGGKRRAGPPYTRKICVRRISVPTDDFSWPSGEQDGQDARGLSIQALVCGELCTLRRSGHLDLAWRVPLEDAIARMAIDGCEFVLDLCPANEPGPELSARPASLGRRHRRGDPRPARTHPDHHRALRRGDSAAHHSKPVDSSTTG